LRSVLFYRAGRINFDSEQFLSLAWSIFAAGFTLTATFVANRFWEIPVSDRFMVENAFFEHLGLVGGFFLVAWHDIRDGYQSQQRQ
jgi:uncharacterized membrane protein YphA (DoxX/SURF4 family)